jgi:hypothetical protein
MKVLIGVDPHKASVAVAALDEAKGQLLEGASFPQSHTGLRALERWAQRFPERRPKRWRTPEASVATWRGGWQPQASRWWTCRPSSRRGCAYSRVATLARTTDSMPSPPRWPHRATKGWCPSIPRLARRCYDSFLRGAY